MRYRLLIVFMLVFSVSLLADEEVRDSVYVEEVEITASRLSHFSSTESTYMVDSLSISRYGTQDLGSLLQKVSLINVQSNGGAGALSTARIRGASSNQTLVTWNGLPVNSLTTGSADLSTISVGGFDDVKVTYGAVGTLYGSGTMGGAIELSNNPAWNKGFQIGINGGLGSFSNYHGSATIGYAGKSISLKSQVIYHDSKNDFSYTDIYDHGQPEETLTHNENKVIGTINNLHLKLGGNYFDVGLWYQVKDKNIPGLMGVGLPVSNQSQTDSTFKAFLGWKRLFNKVRVEAKGAYLSDYLLYTDGYTSEIESQRWLADFNIRWYLLNNLSVDFASRYSRLKGITGNYSSNIEEHEVRFNTAVKYTSSLGVIIATIGKDLNYSENDEVVVTEMREGVPVMVGTEKVNLPHPPVMVSLSGKISVIPDQVALRAKAATHYRRPTFNDRYWLGSGNLNLKPEEGYVLEFGADLLQQSTKFGNISGNVSFYRSENDESIAWKPSGNIWRPANTGEVVTQGIDLVINQQIKKGDIVWDNRLVYGFNDAFDNDKSSENYKETLAYSPKHIIKVGTDIIYSGFNAGALLYSRSKSNTWEGYDVDGYALVDFNVGYQFNLNTHSICLKGQIENIFNTSYQLVRFYPMPGRAYNISISINL